MSEPNLRRLDAGSARRISAAQGVLDPAAAVKELIENALDAGAKRIEIRVRGPAGLSSISVIDDGAGIPRDDLPQVARAHSTSKTNGFDRVRNGSLETSRPRDLWAGWRAAEPGSRCPWSRHLRHSRWIPLALPRSPQRDTRPRTKVNNQDSQPNPGFCRLPSANPLSASS
mmetsp:Transcript_16379/g.33380  ORF Transcript_16379/g.33380 Transcript_16379/m.33380 type:complete len:171 (-) Transcript_16379:2586-3098(-)